MAILLSFLVPELFFVVFFFFFLGGGGEGGRGAGGRAVTLSFEIMAFSGYLTLYVLCAFSFHFSTLQ